MDPSTEQVIDEIPADPSTVDEEQLHEGEQAEATEAEGSEPGAETPADEGAGAPRNKGAERRIRQLTAKWRTAETENEALKQRLDAIEQRLGPDTPARPQRHDFESDEEYEDALFDWRDAAKPAKQQSNQPKAKTSTDVPLDEVAADKLKAKVMANGRRCLRIGVPGRLALQQGDG